MLFHGFTPLQHESLSSFMARLMISSRVSTNATIIEEFFSRITSLDDFAESRDSRRYSDFEPDRDGSRDPDGPAWHEET
jgi:hypothetical protein